jgi:hypothetical protein
MKYTDHSYTIQRREQAQSAEKPRRDLARTCQFAYHEPDGFWEQNILDKWDGKPKYSVNIVNAKINKKYGELASQEVQINIKPSNGGNKDTAKVMCGLMKAIEYQSSADYIYDRNLLRSMIAGFGAAMVETDYGDDYSFNQELFIRDIPDAMNRVWFFGNWIMPTAEDAEAVTVDHMIEDHEFKDTFDVGRKCESLGTDSEQNHYWNKREGEIISQLFYKKMVPETIYQTADGNVIDQEDYDKLKANGVDVSTLEERTRKVPKIYSRWYDNKGWLNDEELTVFDTLPVSPLMANFDIVENIPLWSGDIVYTMDQQRILNYTISKKVSDEVLNAKKKIWVSKNQLNDPKALSQIKTYNTNNDPIQVWTPVDGQPPPFEMGGGIASPAMDSIIQTMFDGIGQTMGLSGVQEGVNQGRMAFESIEALQHKGDVGSLPYHNAYKSFVLRIAKICIGAMPKVYDTAMVKRIIGEGGEYEEAKLNQKIMAPTGEEIVINDLSSGQYDVYCDIGLNHTTKKERAGRALTDMAQYDPSIIAENKDILLGSFSAPGMDRAAKRARFQLMQAGRIPPDEWTDEEKQAQQQAASRPKEPDPMQKIADAELKTAEFGAQKVQAETQLAIIKAEQQQQKMDFEQELQKIKLIEEQQKNSIDNQSKMVDMLNTMADTLNKISQSMGADAIVSPQASMAYSNTAQDINDLTRQI